MPSSAARKNRRSSKSPSKRSFLDLLNSEADLLKNIIRYIGDELLVIDEDGRIVYANDASVNGLGIALKDLIGTPITRFFSKKMTLPQWKKTHLAELKRAKKPVSYQLHRKGRHGQVQVIEATAVYTTLDGRGYIMSLGRDVTRQISLQDGLKESKNLYRLLSEGAADGIITLNLKGEITYVNPAMARLLEIPSRVQEPRLYEQFLSSKHLARARKIFQSVKSGKNFFNQTVDLMTQSGLAIPVEMNISPLYQGRQVVGAHSIVRDLRPRIEKDRLQHESDKMEALKLFIEGAAHELKNPLLGISRIADGLLKKYKNRDFEYISYHDFVLIFSNIERMKNQIEYCYETADRLLRLSQKKAQMDKASTEVKAAIEAVLSSKSAVFKHNGIRVKTSFSRIPCRVKISMIDLSQVIGNILDNAVQAMDAGGLLFVSCGPTKDKTMCELCIKDQGIGIAEEDLPHIFEPFFTTKFRGAHKNLGLGLSIAYALIKSAQGEIQVKSNQRHGTQIRILLPLAGGRSTKA